jgi:hypothetical protein
MNARVGINTDYIEGVDLVKPWNVIDYIENHHGDVFANFLSDVNLGMLNDRFQDNEYTCISTSGKSVVDYICDPYEEMEFIVNTLKLEKPYIICHFLQSLLWKQFPKKLIELDNTEWYRELLTIDVMAKRKQTAYI